MLTPQVTTRNLDFQPFTGEGGPILTLVSRNLTLDTNMAACSPQIFTDAQSPQELEEKLVLLECSTTTSLFSTAAGVITMELWSLKCLFSCPFDKKLIDPGTIVQVQIPYVLKT